MLTDLTHLPDAQRKQLAQLVTAIVKAISPEKIICYGSRIDIMQDWGCFLPGDNYQSSTDTEFDLLIITTNEEKRADHEIIQLCEQQAEPLGCRITTIVHKLAAVNEAIEQGRRFFTILYQKGVLLYNGNDLPLSKPPGILPLAAIKSRMEKSWNKEFEMARRFYDTAKHCLTNGWNELCVFNLHQSVQHGCMALIRSITGYRSQTHNISRLLALTENFSLLPAIIFPVITDEEIELFNLLRNAYSGARYKDDYTVSSDKATILSERVKQLLIISEHLYHKRLQSLTTETAISFPLAINDN